MPMFSYIPFNIDYIFFLSKYIMQFFCIVILALKKIIIITVIGVIIINLTL